MQWSDVSADEQAAIVQYCKDTIANLPPAFTALGASTVGNILDAVLVGSWANNMATPYSDYDIIFVADQLNPFVMSPDPNSAVKGLPNLYLFGYWRNYAIASCRPVDANILPAYRCFDINPTFGFSLIDGTQFATAAALAAKYPAQGQ